MGIDVILVPDRAVNVCKQQLAGLCSPSVILLTAYLLQKITIKSTVPHPAYTYSQTERQTGTHTHIHAQTNTWHILFLAPIFSIRAVPRVAFEAYKHSFAVKRRFDSRPKLFESRLQENTAVTAIFHFLIMYPSKWSSLVFHHSIVSCPAPRYRRYREPGTGMGTCTRAHYAHFRSKHVSCQFTFTDHRSSDNHSPTRARLNLARREEEYPCLKRDQ